MVIFGGRRRRHLVCKSTWECLIELDWNFPTSGGGGIRAAILSVINGRMIDRVKWIIIIII